jgi:lysozyme
MAERDGVDVASYQEKPAHWSGVAGNIGWAAVKVTEFGVGGSRYVNPDAFADAQWLKEHGKGRIFYLYGHPGSSASETAAFFVAEVRKLGLENTDMIAIDLETNDGKTPAEVDDWSMAVLRALEHDLGRIPLVYTYYDFAKTEGNFASHARYPLWISDPDSKPGRPRVPKPWTKWAIHQYEITGPIDRDITGWTTVEKMREYLGYHGKGYEGKKHKTSKPAKPKAPVRKAAAAIARPAVAAVAYTAQEVKAEPVMTGSLGAGALSAAIVFEASKVGIHLTSTQGAAVVTILTALGGLYATLRTKKASVSAVTAILSTIATASVAFGLHWPATFLAADMPIAAAVIGLLLRMHVSPRTALADVEDAAKQVVVNVIHQDAPTAALPATPGEPAPAPDAAAPPAAPPAPPAEPAQPAA